MLGRTEVLTRGPDIIIHLVSLPLRTTTSTCEERFDAGVNEYM